MPSINTYLTFNGNCEKAFEFYKSVFGGEYLSKSRFNEMPPDPNNPIADKDLEKVMHVSLPIGQNTVLMGSDTSGPWSNKFHAGNNFSISIAADDKGEADSLFQALSKDGQVIMPMDKTFWGSYFGMLIDQFGIQWMVSH